MRKPILPEWRYWPATLLAALALLALLGFLSSPTAPPNQPVNAASERHHSETAENSRASIFVDVGQFILTYRDAINLASTALLALVTAALVGVAIYQLRTSRSQLRAYVSGQPDFIYSFNATSRRRARITMLNTGVTPAFMVRYKMGIGVLQHPFRKGDTLPDLVDDWSAPMVLFPNAKFMGNRMENVGFSATEIAAIRNGTMRIMVYGEIEYRDVFRRDWKTRFCSSITADAQTLKKLCSLYGPSDLKITYEIAPMGNDAT